MLLNGMVLFLYTKFIAVRGGQDVKIDKPRTGRSNCALRK